MIYQHYWTLYVLQQDLKSYFLFSRLYHQIYQRLLTQSFWNHKDFKSLFSSTSDVHDHFKTVPIVKTKSFIIFTRNDSNRDRIKSCTIRIGCQAEQTDKNSFQDSNKIIAISIRKTLLIELCIDVSAVMQTPPISLYINLKMSVCYDVCSPTPPNPTTSVLTDFHASFLHCSLCPKCIQILFSTCGAHM